MKPVDRTNSGIASASKLPSSQDITDVLQEAESLDGVDETTESNLSAALVADARSRLNGNPNRKRKRNVDEDDVEGKYMHQLVQEEAKENEIQRNGKAKKRHKMQGSAVGDDNSSAEQNSASESAWAKADHEEVGSDIDIPQHESLATIRTTKEAIDLERASRTVFLANVSTSAITSKAAKKTLLNHLASFVSSLPEGVTPHKIESFRFRSTAFSSNAVPKKAAYAKKELMDATTKSTNAYAVYSTQSAAREAMKNLNGTVVLDRHLRVDSVAHPAKQDHRRCVFVGNLGFVDDMGAMNAADDEENDKRPRKAKEPADVEEGLWRQFSKAGTVESVRVVRDKTTRVGKGFAYVQFLVRDALVDFRTYFLTRSEKDANAVEKALSFDEKKFPPMLPRILRVTRAKNTRKMAGSKNQGKGHDRKERASKSAGKYTPKVSSETQSLSGRAGKLLGRAAAARFHSTRDRQANSTGAAHPATIAEKPIAFEGYRASSKQGKGTTKLGGPKKQGKPRTRSSRRGAEFKQAGGRKGRS